MMRNYLELYKVNLGYAIHGLLLRQISASIYEQFNEMINSISVRAFVCSLREDGYLYFINPWARTTRYRQIFHFAATAFRAAIRLNTLSPHDVTLLARTIPPASKL